LKEHTPELPICRTERFISEYKVPPKDAPALVDDRATADLLDHAAEAGGDKATLAKHFLSFWSRRANERGQTVAGLGVPAGHLAELATLQASRKINATAAAQVADALLGRRDAAGATTPSPAKLAEELGLPAKPGRGRDRGVGERGAGEEREGGTRRHFEPEEAAGVARFLVGQ